MSPLSEVEEDLKEISRYHRNAKRVFFTGANPFVLSFDKLKTLAELVKKYYPKVQSIGCFARITDITPKPQNILGSLDNLDITVSLLVQRRVMRNHCLLCIRFWYKGDYCREQKTGRGRYGL